MKAAESERWRSVTRLWRISISLSPGVRYRVLVNNVGKLRLRNKLTGQDTYCTSRRWNYKKVDINDVVLICPR